jgi:DNA polymerase elongation subunit (family B)
VDKDSDMILFAYDEAYAMHIFTVRQVPTLCRLSVIDHLDRIANNEVSNTVFNMLAQSLEPETGISFVIYRGNTMHTYGHDKVGMEIICDRSRKTTVTKMINNINSMYQTSGYRIYTGVEFLSQETFMCVEMNKNVDFSSCNVMPKSSYDPFTINIENHDNVLDFYNIDHLDATIALRYSIMTFDIETHICPDECYVKNVEEEFITIIGVVFDNRSDHPDDWDRYVLKWTDDVIVGDFDHNWDDPSLSKSWYTHHTKTLIYRSEREMLIGFFDLINELDPDMIMGHNIFGFDFDSIFERLDRHHIPAPSISRLAGEATMRKNKRMTTSARQYKANITTTPGRIMIDTWLVEKLFDPQTKSSARRLIDLAGKYLNSHVGKMEVEYTQLRERYHYLFEVIKYSNGCDLTDEANMAQITSAVLSIQDSLRECERYCLIDAELVLRINQSMLNHIQTPLMARVYVNDPNTVMLVGQGKKLSTIFYCIAISRNYVFNKNTEADILVSMVNKNNLPLPPRDKESKRKKNLDKSKYFDKTIRGGHVIDSVPGVVNLVVTLDFVSLYPSVGIGANAGCDTYCDALVLNDKNYDIESQRDVFESISTDVDLFAEYPDELVIGFVNKDILISITTIMFTLFFNMRKNMKKERSKHDYETPLYRTYDILQLVYKVLLNSIYGYFGPDYSKFQCTAAQGYITYIGRRSLARIEEIARNEGWTLPGGDTDSVFLTRDDSPETILTLANHLIDTIHDDPGVINTLCLELEKICRMIILKKKNYFSWLVYNADITGGWIREDHTFPVDDEGNPEKKWVVHKGMLKKEAKSPLSRITQSRIYNTLAIGGGFDEVKSIINDTIELINSHDTPLEMFILKQKVSLKTMDAESNEANSIIYRNHTLHYRQAQLGDCMKLIVCVIPGNPNTGDTSISARKIPYEFMKEYPNYYEIDRKYYLHDVDSIVMHDLDAIFSAEIDAQCNLVLNDRINNQTSEMLFAGDVIASFAQMKSVDIYKKLVESGSIQHKQYIWWDGPYRSSSKSSTRYPLPDYMPFKYAYHVN